MIDKEWYKQKMMRGLKYPLLFDRVAQDDVEDPRIAEMVLLKGQLWAIVKSHTDWSEPKWKLGDGETPFKDLPYCSGPPTVAISLGRSPFHMPFGVTV